MTIKIKTAIVAAAIVAASVAGANTASAAAFTGSNIQTLQTETAQKGAGVQQARYWRYRRCFRVPVYRYRWTPFGWRRVFVGFRIRCRRRFWGYRRYRPGFRIRLSF